MYVLGLDFETTGVDTAKDLVTEVGAVLWDWEAKMPVVVEDYFIHWYDLRPDFAERFTQEVQDKTRIEPKHLLDFGVNPTLGLQRLHGLMDRTNIIVAHNGAEFDQLIYKNWGGHLLAAGHDPGSRGMDSHDIWIDTMHDIEYSPDITTRKLSYLAAEHGFLNPWAHRAVFDVLTMMKMVSQYNLDDLVHSAKQPMVIVQALVSFNEKDLAKERKFYWDADNKRWIKKVKQHRVDAVTADLPFRTKLLLC